MVIPYLIYESVSFPLPDTMIIWDASHELLDTIPIFEAFQTQSGVSFLQHVVIVRLYALLFDSTLDIFVVFKCCKQEVRIALSSRLKPTLSVGLPWLSNVISQQSASAEFCLRPWNRRWRWLRIRVCDIFTMFEVFKHVQVFYSIFVNVLFIMLSRFNPLGCAGNSQILLACNFKVMSMV